MGPRHPPFGLPSQSTGGAAAGNTTQPIQWSSEFYDSELALVYYNYRHYNPADGRWIGRDAMHEADHNQLYIFAFNNALYARDYLGLFSISEEYHRLVGDGCPVGHMKAFKVYNVVKNATDAYSWHSPSDNEQYRLTTSAVAKFSELALSARGHKLAKSTVGQNSDMVNAIWNGLDKIQKGRANNATHIVVWYKFSARCCVCDGGLWNTNYYKTIETEWKSYPNDKSGIRHAFSRATRKFEKKNVLAEYAKIVKYNSEHFCDV